MTLRVRKVDSKDPKFKFDSQIENEILKGFQEHGSIYIHVGGYEFDRRIRVFSIDEVPEEEEGFLFEWLYDLPLDKMVAVEVGPSDAYRQRPYFMRFYDDPF